MVASMSNSELWRLGINSTLTQLLAAMLYSISVISYLPSIHRFVTNPTEENLNGTSHFKVEPEAGLGESEFFYSLAIACMYIGSVTGGFLSAFLVKFVPYWYLFILFLSAHVLGFVLYGTASHGWALLPAMFFVGLFAGAEVTLVFNYATDISVKYVDLLKERGKTFNCDKTKAVKIRNYLYASHSFGYSIGFIVATGVAVLLSHLPIEQYRSIAWFNMACGVTVLLLFMFFFRGESSWENVSNITKMCRCSCQCKTEKDIKFGSLQIFIIVSLHLLSFVEMMKWAYLDVLLNPVLSDSFGLSLGMSSYFYLALAVPRILGTVLLVILQRIKFTTQTVAFIGILLSLIGYLLISDWQTIPYDPCTKYSPFHHPELSQNDSSHHTHNETEIKWMFDTRPVNRVPFTTDLSFTVHSGINGSHDKLPTKTSSRLHLTCQVNADCSLVCETQRTDQLCLTLIYPNSDNPLLLKPTAYSCSIQHNTLCINIYHQSKRNLLLQSNANVQRLMVLPAAVYDKASNSCMNSIDGQCHWIPFSTLTHKKCIDCPPICRGKQQTLLFPLFILGMALQVMSNPLIWVPTIALATNQTPKSMQAIIIGSINAINAVGQSIGPILVDALYEGAQKRTFIPSTLLAVLHIPFLIGIIILYQKLGPKK